MNATEHTVTDADAKSRDTAGSYTIADNDYTAAGVSGRMTDIMEISPPQIVRALLSGLDRHTEATALSATLPTSSTPAFAASMNNHPWVLRLVVVGKFRQEYLGYEPVRLADWRSWWPIIVAEHAKENGWPLLDASIDATYGLHVAEGLLKVQGSPVYAAASASDRADYVRRQTTVQERFTAINGSTLEPWSRKTPKADCKVDKWFHFPDAPCLFVPLSLSPD